MMREDNEVWRPPSGIWEGKLSRSYKAEGRLAEERASTSFLWKKKERRQTERLTQREQPRDKERPSENTERVQLLSRMLSPPEVSSANTAARVIRLRLKSDHVTSLLETLPLLSSSLSDSQSPRTKPQGPTFSGGNYLPCWLQPPLDSGLFPLPGMTSLPGCHMAYFLTLSLCPALCALPNETGPDFPIYNSACLHLPHLALSVLPTLL